MDTMGKIMFSYFKSYTGRLDRYLSCSGCIFHILKYFDILNIFAYPETITRLQYEESASREDLLGAEETQVNIWKIVS